MKSIQVMFIGMALMLTTLSVAEEDKKSWLFVQTASHFSLTGNQLTVPYEREVFAFTDRPNRLYGHLNAHEFEALWQTGGDDFGSNPPNAVLTWVADGEIHEAEIEITGAKVDERGRSIIYQIKQEAEDALPHHAERISLFVDPSSFFSPDVDPKICC